MILHTSAPATLMLLGEHAVLHGKHAIVTAVDQRLHVYLTPRQDQVISIESALGHYESPLHDLKVEAPFTFVLSLIQRCARLCPPPPSRRRVGVEGQPPPGFHLRVESDFSSTVGLGSSAAVLVATAAAVMRYWKIEADLFEVAYQSLIEVQGRGSGADLAAAIHGGVLLFKSNAAPLPLTRGNRRGFALRLVYSGYKTPTPQVIAIVDAARQKDPETFARLFDEIDAAVLAGAAALQEQNWEGFAKAMDRNQVLMEKLGVCDETLSRIIKDLRQEPGVLAAKISGSGLGDCVYAIRKQKTEDRRQNIFISPYGVLFHD